MTNSSTAPEVLKKECEAVIGEMDTVEPERPCRAHGILTRALKALLRGEIAQLERDQTAHKITYWHAVRVLGDLLRLAIVAGIAAAVAVFLSKGGGG